MRRFQGPAAKALFLMSAYSYVMTGLMLDDGGGPEHFRYEPLLRSGGGRSGQCGWCAVVRHTTGQCIRWRGCGALPQDASVKAHVFLAITTPTGHAW
ncbi:hypothetical protein KZ779_07735 [Escherichia coli]|nr:hypothetical protein [Escherichia coli]